MTVEKVIPAFATSTLVDGDLFYWQTDEFKRLPIGAANKKLISSGGLPAWVYSGDNLATAISESMNSGGNLATATYYTLAPTSAIVDPRGLYDATTKRITFAEASTEIVILVVEWTETVLAYTSPGKRHCAVRRWDATPTVSATNHIADAQWVGPIMYGGALKYYTQGVSVINFPAGYSMDARIIMSHPAASPVVTATMHLQSIPL